MNQAFAQNSQSPPLDASVVRHAADEAMTKVPPLFPLAHFVAVNPFLGHLDSRFEDACAVLTRTTGSAPLLPASTYLTLYQNNRISDADLALAGDGEFSAEELVAALEQPPAVAGTAMLRTVVDGLDAHDDRDSWARFIAEEISKWCSAYFDTNQTTWTLPWRAESLYAAWQAGAQHDHNPEAFGIPGFRKFVRQLPSDAWAAIELCLAQIAPGAGNPAELLQRELFLINGWAAFAQYVVREEVLRGREHGALRDLLAIRLAYDAALLTVPGAAVARQVTHRHLRADPSLTALVRWQRAYELGYQRELATTLAGHTPAANQAEARPTFQAVFCIDVRSEVLRRHLERAAPSAQTLGFAGFFGFPVSHRQAEADKATARCPVLLVPPLETEETGGVARSLAARRSRAVAAAWKAAQNAAASCFSFVESAGLGFGPALASLQGKDRAHWSHAASPLTVEAPPGQTLDSLVAMAEGALRNMSLTRDFARLLLLCGHGSQSANNPYASALDCGACGGHAGDVNARLAAYALNLPAVREQLAARGIVLPDDTYALGGLHDTMLDDIVLFDVEQLPTSHAADLKALQAALAQAGAATRAERAPSLGLAHLSSDDLSSALRARSRDISHVRPEWGLAGNAAIIVAPRARTRGLALGGRTFLHDYLPDQDPDGKVLAVLLAAPVVVASWINLQYYASRVDPQRYGSGNKVLHNVAGGLGVFEGNGGDLKVGLPLQSIHDGERFVHEPRRLSVFVEAPRERLLAALAAQPSVKRLFDNGWIHLFVLEGTGCARYTAGGFEHFAARPETGVASGNMYLPSTVSN